MKNKLQIFGSISAILFVTIDIVCNLAGFYKC